MLKIFAFLHSLRPPALPHHARSTRKSPIMLTNACLSVPKEIPLTQPPAVPEGLGAVRLEQVSIKFLCSLTPDLQLFRHLSTTTHSWLTKLWGTFVHHIKQCLTDFFRRWTCLKPVLAIIFDQTLKRRRIILYCVHCKRKWSEMICFKDIRKIVVSLISIISL
jgi:hypothetical protein